MSYQDELQIERHQVKTADGFILTLFRMPRPHDAEAKIEDGLETRKPVLVCHGLLCEGSHWLMNDPEKCLPHILTAGGYDCWLANLRGTTESKKHDVLSRRQQEFWNFSWDEMAKFDIPALIDYILETTGSQKLFYIGHSMGCLAFFASMSLYPQNCEKIYKMIALAPAIYARNLTNAFVRFGVQFGNTFAQMKSICCNQVPMGRKPYISTHLNLLKLPFIPSAEKIGGYWIKTFGVLFGMFSKEQIEEFRLPRIAQSWPSTTSIKTVFHIAQLYASNKVQSFNYGKMENQRIYGSDTPPTYNLEKVQLPVVIFSSAGDSLCSPKDIHQASLELPNVIKHLYIDDENFSHIDFMAGKDADAWVFHPIVEMFNGTFVYPSKG